MYTGQRQLEVQEVPAPEGAFLVRVAGCAICGTDLKTYLHGHPYFKPPTILGHEFYGTVEAAPAQTGYQKGDPVVVAPYGDCGACDLCARGAGELCSHKRYVSSGAFCELVSVPLDFVADGVIRLDRPDEAFALVEPLACVLCGLDKVRLEHVRRCLIVGGGPMGALFALTLMDRGLPVDVVEPNERRRACLNGWGIPAFDSGAADYGAYDLIVVAVNKPELIAPAVAGVADNGTVHMFAGMPSGSSVTLDARAIHYRAVTLTAAPALRLRISTGPMRSSATIRTITAASSPTASPLPRGARRSPRWRGRTPSRCCCGHEGRGAGQPVRRRRARGGGVRGADAGACRA